MKIEKIFNNNVISALDEQSKELVIMGRGIGFQKKPGQLIEQEKIEKIFRLDNPEVSEQFKTLLLEVPIETMEVSESIIQYAKTVFNKRLSDNIYVALTDHINYAIERHKKGQHIQNGLLWEIKKLYKDEYVIGQEAVRMIKEKLDVSLPEDEAGFIAIHVVNAELADDMLNIVAITKLIKNVLTLIQFHYRQELDEDSLNYFRFITHLKFFAQRLLNGVPMNGKDDELFQAIKRKHPQAYACTQKIDEFLQKEFQHCLTTEEQLYLTIHIERITVIK